MQAWIYIDGAAYRMYFNDSLVFGLPCDTCASDKCVPIVTYAIFLYVTISSYTKYLNVCWETSHQIKYRQWLSVLVAFYLFCKGCSSLFPAIPWAWSLFFIFACILSLTSIKCYPEIFTAICLKIRSYICVVRIPSTYTTYDRIKAIKCFHQYVPVVQYYH